MKRIISAILAITFVFSTGIFTFASNLDDIFKSVQEEKAQNESKDAPDDAADGTTDLKDIDPYVHLPSFLRPTDQLYKIFIEVLKLYTKDHLYDFTEADVLYKFIYDMISTHPEIYEMMLNTMLGTMDPYSAYHEKKSSYLSLTSSSAGYGITVTETKNGIVITEVLTQSEAEKAGILPGDIITGVCGFDATQLPWFALSLILKTPYKYFFEADENNKYSDYNPAITITVNRNGTALTFTLKKGLMVTNELTTNYKEMDGVKVAYVSVSSFIAEDLATRFKSAIEKIKNDGYSKLVIDLRDNGGGSLDLAISMAELFVENGTTMCYYNDKNSEEPKAIISDAEKVTFDSISVLVNKNTASAAELMASILRNCAGAVLVGNKTFGKAIGQTVYSLQGGAHITITTYEILDANKSSYNNEGLMPDLVLDNVEMLYTLPPLEVFNHVNYKEITVDVYSEPCLALEKRLEILGFLKGDKVDGIWDYYTSLAVYILQTTYFPEKGFGYLDDSTVTLVTDLINSCKDDTYLEDSQLECALLYHSSFDQARRLIKEKETLAKKQAELIKENNKKLEAEAELEDLENE